MTRQEIGYRSALLAALLAGVVLPACSTAVRVPTLDAPAAASKPVSGVLLFHGFKSNLPLPGECTLTLESLDGNRRYEIPMRTAEDRTIAQVPPGKYTFRDIDCSSVRSFDRLGELLKDVVEVHEGRISLIADCVFEFEVLNSELREFYVISSSLEEIRDHLAELGRAGGAKLDVAPGFLPRVPTRGTKPLAKGKGSGLRT